MKTKAQLSKEVLSVLSNLVRQGEICLYETLENGGHTVDVSISTIREARLILDEVKTHCNK